MKNMKTNGMLYAILGLVGLAVVAGIWFAVGDFFYTLVQDDFRAAIVATAYTVALAGFALAIFRADDRRTFQLATGLTVLFFAAGIAMFFGNAAYRAASGDITQIPEPIQWAVPFTWVIPVFTGTLFFILQSLDVYWGVNKQPLAEGGNSRVVAMGYRLFYNITIAFALIGSALGTYDVMYAITKSFWHSFVYVLTVELAILGFAHFTHSTKDRSVFWWAFGATLTYFGVAMLFQLVDSAIKISGSSSAIENKYMQFLAQNFVLLPPILTGGFYLALLAYNQRKTPEPFVYSRSGMASRGDVPYQVSRHDSAPSDPDIGAPPRPPMQQGYQPRPPQLEQGQREGQYPPSGGTSVQPQGQHHTPPSGYFASGGGLEEDTLAALLAMGYSRGFCRRTTQAEAERIIAEKIMPRPDQRPQPQGQPKNKGQSQGNPNKGSTNVGSNNQTSSITTNQRPTEEQTRHNVGAFSENGRDGDSNPH